MTISRAQIFLPLKSWYYDGVTAKTKNIGALGGTATLGDGTTVGTFPTLLNPNGMSFDGGDYLDCGNVADYTNNFTLFCGFSAYAKNQHDLIRRHDGANYQFDMYVKVTTGYLAFYVSGGGGVDVASTRSVSDGPFHTCCAVVSANNASLYVDGELVAGPTAVAIASLATTLRLGVNVVGNMYLPQVYNFALTPTQIRFLDSMARKMVNV